MKQMKHFFSSMLAVMAAAVMLTACDQVADNPTVPAKLTVTETNGVKVTKLTLTSVGTNHVYDLTPYITDADGMSSFSCDQIFIDGGASDLYYNVYAEDKIGSKYEANVYLNMVRGQQNTLEVTLKQTFKGLTLSELVTVLTNPVDEGAQLVFTFPDGSKVAYVPKNIAAEGNDPVYWFTFNNPQVSGSYFNEIKNLNIKYASYEDDDNDNATPEVRVPKTFEDNFGLWPSSAPQSLSLEFNPDWNIDSHYYYGYWDSALNTWVDPSATKEEQAAVEKARKSFFKVDFKVDETSGDYYLLTNDGSFEVPTITYRKDAASDFAEIKGLKNGDTEKVAVSTVSPEGDDWDILAAKIPEDVAKFEAGYTFTYDKSITTWDDLLNRFGHVYGACMNINKNGQIVYSDRTVSWIANNDDNVIVKYLDYQSGALNISYNFYLQKKNADGTLTLVKVSDTIDPNAKYVFAQVDAPED